MFYSFVGIPFHEKLALIIRLRKTGTHWKTFMIFTDRVSHISHDHVQIGTAPTYHRFPIPRERQVPPPLVTVAKPPKRPHNSTERYRNVR